MGNDKDTTKDTAKEKATLYQCIENMLREKEIICKDNLLELLTKPKSILK